MDLKDSNNFWLPLIISVIHGHFQFKFRIYMCHKNAQVKFRYAFILIVFSNVVHLALMYHSVRHFLTSPRHIHTFLVLEQVSQESLKIGNYGIRLHPMII